MLNFDPLCGPNSSLEVTFINLESKLYEDACIVIPQSVILGFLSGIFLNSYLYISLLNFGASVWVVGGLTILTIIYYLHKMRMLA